jgi:hypothetical protein
LEGGAEMNCAKEFEIFMAGLPDYKGAPVWDRFLCNFWEHRETGSDNQLCTTLLNGKDIVCAAFAWHDSPEGFWFWQHVSWLWKAHLSALEEQR